MTKGSATTTYGYDQDGRLTSVSGSGTTATYRYDADGLRTKKTVNGTTTSFTWDAGANLLWDGTTSYVYGPGGAPVAQIGASSTLWYFTDQLGSTRALTDSSGTIVGTYGYTPYGTLISHTGTASTPLQFTGQYTDTETGFIYLRARYYDPATAQFLAVDPAVRSTLSPYGYVSGNPLNAADPSGLCGTWCKVGVVVGIGVGVACAIAEPCGAAVAGALGLGSGLTIGVGGSLALAGGGVTATAITIPAGIVGGTAAAGISSVVLGGGMEVLESRSSSGGGSGGGGSSSSDGCAPTTAGRVRPAVSDSKLSNYVEQLYKHQGQPGVVGDGTTMDALPGEVRAGTGRHIQKSQEIVRGLNKWIGRMGPNATESDLRTAISMRDELQSLLGPFRVG